MQSSDVRSEDVAMLRSAGCGGLAAALSHAVVDQKAAEARDRRRNRKARAFALTGNARPAASGRPITPPAASCPPPELSVTTPLAPPPRHEVTAGGERTDSPSPPQQRRPATSIQVQSCEASST